MPLQLSPTFRDRLAGADRSQVGMWVCSGSPLVAEICAGSGLDWLLVDMEHSPNGLKGVLAQLQAVAPYPVTTVVRVPSNDTVAIKQVLDLGAQNIIVPMVSDASQARSAAEAMLYPPHGRRGVGSALARSGRWNRVPDYLTDAAQHVSLMYRWSLRRPWRMPRKWPPWRASTASSWARRTWPRRWACWASRTIPT